MMIKSSEEIIIYESPDGGRTIYSRKSGSPLRELHSKDPLLIKEERITNRWAQLKEIVEHAEDNPALNDLLEKLEMLYTLTKNNSHGT
jgi:hypothetical protein